MMEYTSKLMDFDWVSRRGHEECQKGRRPERMRGKEKKKVSGQGKECLERYRYANCSLGYALWMEFQRFGCYVTSERGMLGFGIAASVSRTS
jgi:hypothetical protein